MSNVLSEEKRQQVIALGRLGWTLRRIEQATGAHRETAGGYLRAVGVAVRPPDGWGRQPSAKPAIEVSTDPTPSTSLQTTVPNSEAAKPANETSTDFFAATTGEKAPGRSPAASACEPLSVAAIESGKVLAGRAGRGVQSARKLMAGSIRAARTAGSKPAAATTSAEMAVAAARNW